MAGGKMRARRGVVLAVLAMAMLLLLALALATPVEAKGRLQLRRGQRASVESSMHSDDAAADGGVSHVAARRSAMERVGKLRLRAHAAAEGEAQSQSALALGAAATLKATGHLPSKVNRRGAGGKAGRAGGKAGGAGNKAGIAAGNAGQSGRKAGDAAGNGGQSGRKAGDAAGNGGQSGRKAGDAAGNGGQSGRKAGDASGNGGQSGRKAGDASGNGGQSGRKAGDTGGDGGQSGRKAGVLLPVSPITGSPPPDASNVMTLMGVKRNWPVKVYLRNQGDAATCWAHSAVTLLELREQMSTDRNRMTAWYSVDQIVRCVPNDGAGGGSPLDALEFLLYNQRQTDAQVRAGEPILCSPIVWELVMNAGATATHSRYPMLVLKPCVTPGEDCTRMRDYEYEMERQFASTPMIAYVDASQWHTYAPRVAAGQKTLLEQGLAADYSGVVFPSSKCSMDPTMGDHLVILLGTVTCPKTKKKYWRAYNSWGKEWGVNGYIFLEYEKNACGLANYPVGLADELPFSRGFTAGAVMLLPKTMTQMEGYVTPEYKRSGTGLLGGKQVWMAMQANTTSNSKK